MNSTLQRAYVVTPFLGMTNHFHRGDRTLRDWDDGDSVVMARPFYNRELEAQVRSGDYFITLATSLDTLSRQLSDYSAKMMLEDVVSDLIYLYDNYDIERRREGTQ